MSDVSLAELRLIAQVSGVSMPLELLEYRAGVSDHALFCDIVDRAIDMCALEMAQYPKEFDGQSEDQLSVSLILQLSKIGFSASHDTTTGGHCDIVIKESGGILWLAEAKKVTGKQNKWISGGYDQLMKRYSTGISKQDRGGLIIFCNAPRMDEILESWCAYYAENIETGRVENYNKDEIYFNTTDKHHKTGKEYKVRHKPISVYFEPLHKDAVAKVRSL